MPRHRHGETHGKVKSSSSVEKQTQQCFPGKVPRDECGFADEILLSLGEDGGRGPDGRFDAEFIDVEVRYSDE